MGPATYLKIDVHGKTAADIDKRLSELYYDNGLYPFWIEDGTPGSRAADMLAVLDEAGNHGLDPADYFADRIHSYWGSTETTDLVRLDILLTLGMMRYVADQREGRLEPRSVDPELFAASRDVAVDWDTLRKEAFTATDMRDFLEKQVPPFPPDCAQHGTLSLVETDTPGRTSGSGQYRCFRGRCRQAGIIRRENAGDRRQTIP